MVPLARGSLRRSWWRRIINDEPAKSNSAMSDKREEKERGREKEVDIIGDALDTSLSSHNTYTKEAIICSAHASSIDRKSVV